MALKERKASNITMDRRGIVDKDADDNASEASSYFINLDVINLDDISSLTDAKDGDNSIGQQDIAVESQGFTS